MQNAILNITYLIEKQILTLKTIKTQIFQIFSIPSDLLLIEHMDLFQLGNDEIFQFLFCFYSRVTF